MAATSTPKNRQSRLAWMTAMALASALHGCAPAPATGPTATGAASPTSTAGESVVIDGSSTLYPISREAMLSYKKVKPDINVIVNKSGTGGGFGKYLENKLDIVDASRPATEKEAAAAKSRGLDWVIFLVGYDGITVVVNPKNTFVKDLSVGQLKTLWEKDSKVKTWKDLDPSWPDRPISFHCPDKDSGTYDFFTQEIGTHKNQREDVQPSSDDNKLVRGVSGDDDGIGYFGYAYYEANSSSLRAIPIKKSDDAPAVAPSPETILDKSYSPLSRPLFLYVKKSSLRRPEVKAFVKYYIENAKSLATDAGYVAPMDADDAANKKALEP